jgi:hypoxanthine phosphoribosyltransferase
MKVYLDYTTFKSICLALAEKIAEYKPDEIVAVSRGGISAAHIIAKSLGLPIGYFFPGEPTGRLVLAKETSRKIVLIEDLVAEGRTFFNAKITMDSLNKCFKPDEAKFEYKFVPVLIDANSKDTFDIYGFKTPIWVVFPYEEMDKMKEGDHGLFRAGTDAYGK